MLKGFEIILAGKTFDKWKVAQKLIFVDS